MVSVPFGGPTMPFFVYYEMSVGEAVRTVATAAEAVEFHRMLVAASAEAIRVKDDSGRIVSLRELLALTSTPPVTGRGALPEDQP